MPESTFTNCPVVFELDYCWMKDSGLLTEESVLETDAEGCVHILVSNPTVETQRISAGVNIGQVGHFVEACPDKLLESIGVTDEAESGQVSHVGGDHPDLDQLEELAKVVEGGREKLTKYEKQQILDCVILSCRPICTD